MDFEVPNVKSQFPTLILLELGQGTDQLIGSGPLDFGFLSSAQIVTKDRSMVINRLLI